MIINVQTMTNLVTKAPQGGFGSQGFGGADFGGFSGGGFEDIFSSFFGGGSRQRDPNAPRKGDDLQYTMTVTFEEAVFGTKKKYLYVKTLHVIHVMVKVLNQVQARKLVVTVTAQDTYQEQNTILGRVHRTSLS